MKIRTDIMEEKLDIYVGKTKERLTTIETDMEWFRERLTTMETNIGKSDERLTTVGTVTISIKTSTATSKKEKHQIENIELELKENVKKTDEEVGKRLSYQLTENIQLTREVTTLKMSDYVKTSPKTLYHSEEDNVTEIPRKDWTLNFVQKLVQDLDNKRLTREIKVKYYNHVPR